MKILIAEDNLYTIQQYKMVLENHGCKVTIAHDGQECVKKYNDEIQNNENSFSTPFDVVLIDNNMPKKSGAEAAKEILDIRPNQRIIFASAYDIETLLAGQGLIKASVEILQKPFTLYTMVHKIQTRK